VKKWLLNKQGKYDIKKFFHYVNIATFVLGHFFLNHPVDVFAGINFN